MALDHLSYLAATEPPNADIFSGVRDRGRFEPVDAKCLQVVTGAEALSKGSGITGEPLSEGDVLLVLQILSESTAVRGKIAFAMSSLVRGLVAPEEVVKLLVARDRSSVLRVVSKAKGSCTYGDPIPYSEL